ncbi:MAG: leucyl aminopeptidase [Pseudomonadota bacterium]|nr:MAG: leucyl aminopeptidase [Pseudomonadota bacterium]
MDIRIQSAAPEKQASACVVVGVFEPRRLSAAAARIDQASGGYLSALLRKGDMDGKPGQVMMLHDVAGIPANRLLLVGCGKERELGPTQYGAAVTAAVKTLNDTGARDAHCFLTELPVKDRDAHWLVRQAVETTLHCVYRFDRLKSEKDTVRNPLRRIAFNVEHKRDVKRAQKAAAEGQAIGAGVSVARELGNLPGNVCTPTYLADEALGIARKYKNIRVKVLEQKDMERLKMGALLSVARGSRQPPKLITLEYKGADAKHKPVVLVGKGITFDAGGISIKPAAAMDEMKFDMCGAASVLGTLTALGELQLPINVVGIVPSCENLPDGNANKPGDIVESMSGQTIEVLNTDAEGRLILCDALSYAERFNPTVVIDIATLTGACVIALGKHASGLLSNHPPLADNLITAGNESGDRAWQLPLWEEYQQQLSSNFADMANIGGREAGTITAACFLARFTKKYKWAHLDIAGTAWNTGQEKGATGRPVPLLTQYLLDRGRRR